MNATTPTCTTARAYAAQSASSPLAQASIPRRAPTDRECGVSVNGGWPVFERQETADLLFPAGPYTRHVEEHRAWNYRLDCAAIRDGWNEIVVYNESAEELSVVGVELAIKRKPPSAAAP
jgi:hypothetical protein